MARSHPLGNVDRAPMDWDGMVGGSIAPHLTPQALTEGSAERDARGYTVRGEFASRGHFAVPQHVLDCMRDEPEEPVTWPRWHSIAAFLVMSMSTIFAMCAIGRAGA